MKGFYGDDYSLVKLFIINQARKDMNMTSEESRGLSEEKENKENKENNENKA